MLIAFNKPYGMLCQFTPEPTQVGHPTLAEAIAIPHVYPAGRLDTDSEGLLLLTDNGQLQQRISHPQHKLPKTYWAQVEGQPTEAELEPLRRGVILRDGQTQPCTVTVLDEPTVTAQLWARTPPIRFRQNKPTSWLALILTEGKNRQVRRMTAAIGFPTLRLVRVAIGPINLFELVPQPAQWVEIDERTIPPRR